MSAGTGVTHSELNRHPEVCRFIQVWLTPDRCCLGWWGGVGGSAACLPAMPVGSLCCTTIVTLSLPHKLTNHQPPTQTPTPTHANHNHRRGHAPQYGSSTYTQADRHNRLLRILGGTGAAPDWPGLHSPNAIELHQDANIVVSELDAGRAFDLELGASRQGESVCALCVWVVQDGADDGWALGRLLVRPTAAGFYDATRLQFYFEQNLRPPPTPLSNEPHKRRPQPTSCAWKGA